MSKVRLTRCADSDLEEIWGYIARDSVRNADRLLDKLHTTFWKLARQPGTGPACPGIAEDLRCFPVGNYVIYYRPIEQGIAIVRVLHRARDAGQLSFEE